LFSSNGKYERENSKPELTATELPLTNELNLAWSREINDKTKLIQVHSYQSR
jgi:hypothetical protein